MTNNSPEYGPRKSPGQRLTDILNAKFESTTTRLERPLAREHEEVLALVPTTGLYICPTATKLTAERPIPGKEEAAQNRWKILNGHRVRVTEHRGRIQTDFIAVGAQVFMRRQIFYPGEEPTTLRSTPEEMLRNLEREVEELIGLSALGKAAREEANRKYEKGEPLEDEQDIEAILAWIESAELEQ